MISSMAKFIPHDYQNVAKKFALEREAAGLFLDMGLRQDSYNTNSHRRIKERLSRRNKSISYSTKKGCRRYLDY